MNRAPDRSRFFAPTIEGDTAWFQQELDEAHKTVRSLMRQIDKEQARYQEIARAYNLTVSNLVTLTHENNALERERDMWRARARRCCALPDRRRRPDADTGRGQRHPQSHRTPAPPDTGGDSERLKAWNAALDLLED